MCHIIRRDVAVTVGAALSRPIDPAQLLSCQHAANLRGRLGSCLSKRQHVGHGVWFAALRTDFYISLVGLLLWLSVLYCKSGSLAQGLFPSRKHTSTGRMKPCQTKPANTDTRDSTAAKSLWVCF